MIKDLLIFQAYHICHDGREGHQGASFLCTNGTLFNQQEFACDWWYNVNCADAPTLYRYNYIYFLINMILNFINIHFITKKKMKL